MDKIREFLESVAEKGKRTLERTAYDLCPTSSTFYDYGAAWVAGETLDMLEALEEKPTRIEQNYITVLPGRVKTLLKKLSSSGLLEPTLADIQTVYRLEAEGMDRGKAYFNVGADCVLSMLKNAIDTDIVKTVNSKKKELLHQLQDLGVSISVEDESYRGDKVNCSVYGWPKGKDDEPYKL